MKRNSSLISREDEKVREPQYLQAVKRRHWRRLIVSKGLTEENICVLQREIVSYKDTRMRPIHALERKQRTIGKRYVFIIENEALCVQLLIRQLHYN